MTGEKDKALDEAYQSDPGETEDEEVKRNCIMGESGMRDSDYFDSDSDEDQEEIEDHVDGEMKNASDRDSEEDRIVQLVKFVSVGSQILKPKGVALCRPTPIVPVTALHSKSSDESDETAKESTLKINLPTSHDDSTSGFSPRSKSDCEIEISASSSSVCSSRDSDSDSNDGDVESIESEAENRSSSLEFPFEDGQELALEVGAEITNIATDSLNESCCKSSFDDSQETNESMEGEYALVGASGASVDDKWQMPKQKRVLSCNTLSALNQEAGRDEDQAKKSRLCQMPSQDVCAIPEITIASEALDEIIQPLPRLYLVRDDSLLVPSSSDEEEDQVLSEELEEKFRSKRYSVANFPIPLLTPPQSPRTVDGTIDDQEMSAIEWPSNLVMDSAIIKAFASISPLSTVGKRNEELATDDSMGEQPVQRKLGPRIRTISVENRDGLL